MFQRSVTVLLLGVLTAGASPAGGRLPASASAAIERITAAELRAHVSLLASDALAGRGLGHAGNREAEQYIARVLRDAGVTPAIPGYLQPVEVYQPRLGTGSRLVATADGTDTLGDLTPGRDFYPLQPSGDREAHASVLFAGHGISAPALQHDDYARIDARGAILLVLDDAPEELKKRGPLTDEERSDLGSVERKVTDARQRGAAGLIVMRQFMSDPKSVWRETTSVQAASYRLLAPMRAAPLAVVAVSEKAAAPIRQALERHRAVRARIVPGIVAAPVVMHNVIGIVEGRQPSAGMVVVGAHLDHDGIDESGRIYNGADDNASGTAAVMALAAAFARAAAAGDRPARAVVFALWNGEEKGSLGAGFYAAAPVPARRIVASINLDMIGRDEEIPDPGDPRYSGFAKVTAAASGNVVHLLGYTYSPDLAAIVGRANEGLRLTIRQDYDRGAQGLLRRSDNWPFLEHGIPAVFLTTGLHPDYHTPADDTERIDFAKLERIAELAGRAAWMTADGDPPRMTSR